MLTGCHSAERAPKRVAIAALAAGWLETSGANVERDERYAAVTPDLSCIRIAGAGSRGVRPSAPVTTSDSPSAVGSQSPTVAAPAIARRRWHSASRGSEAPAAR